MSWCSWEKNNSYQPTYITAGHSADSHLHSVERRVVLLNFLFLPQVFILTHILNNGNNGIEMQRLVTFKIVVMRKCAKIQSQMKRTILLFKIGNYDIRGFPEFLSKAFIVSSILLWIIVCQNFKVNSDLLAYNSFLKYLSSVKSWDA